MLKRDEAILKWLDRNRPGDAKAFRVVIANRERDPVLNGMYVFSAMIFEAGREFQHENPELELDNPSIYLE